MLTALSSELGQRPREQVQTYVVEGRSFDLDDGLAGPCFTLGWNDVPCWTLGFDTASYAERSAVGVVSDGPAYKAGLREGMDLKGWSVFGGDTAKEVELNIKTEDGDQMLRYLPIDGSMDRLPTMSV